MNKRKTVIRQIITVSIVSTLVIANPFNGLAIPEEAKQSFAKNSFELPKLQEPTAVLTIIGGGVTVNGNSAVTGLTILSNSTIATSSRGKAMIDLGSLGRIEIRESSTATLIFTRSILQVKTSCDKAKVEVTRGQVDIVSPKQETIYAGNAQTYDGQVEILTSSADLTIDCSTQQAVPTARRRGYLGLLLLGTSIGVILGTGVGAADDDQPIINPSPIR